MVQAQPHCCRIAAPLLGILGLRPRWQRRGQGPAPHVAQGAAVVSMAHGDLVMAHDPWDFCFEVSELSWINVGQEPWRFGSLDCC